MKSELKETILVYVITAAIILCGLIGGGPRVSSGFGGGTSGYELILDSEGNPTYYDLTWKIQVIDDTTYYAFGYYPDDADPDPTNTYAIVVFSPTADGWIVGLVTPSGLMQAPVVFPDRGQAMAFVQSMAHKAWLDYMKERGGKDA